jgi:hypothetical protein
MTSNNKIAKRIVARHTRHGLSKSDAKSQKVISSLGKERIYAQSISTYLEWCHQNGIHPDFYSKLCNLAAYLEERSEYIQQGHLNNDRQALQLVYKQKLPYVTALNITILKKRSYTMKQMIEIALHQSEKNSLTTQLAFFAGIRAHEAATILPLEERLPSQHRAWSSNLFVGLDAYKLYTVQGKGGLIRKVAVPIWLAEKLEARRFSSPVRAKDRGIIYMKNYDVGIGQAWSQSFTSASKRTLGYSTGGHGLRHSYFKLRLQTLLKELRRLKTKNYRSEALKIVSQELGHFRIEITFCYFR